MDWCKSSQDVPNIQWTTLLDLHSNFSLHEHAFSGIEFWFYIYIFFWLNYQELLSFPGTVWKVLFGSANDSVGRLFLAESASVPEGCGDVSGVSWEDDNNDGVWSVVWFDWAFFVFYTLWLL